jgi:hypothetical protein
MSELHEEAANMRPEESPTPYPGNPTQVRQWQLLVEELNRLNAQLEYLKLMLKLDLKRRGPTN